MTRYIVLDTHRGDDGGEAPGGMRGRILGRFQSHDRAKALALHWMSSGDIGVVVIDLVQGERVFPRG